MSGTPLAPHTYACLYVLVCMCARMCACVHVCLLVCARGLSELFFVCIEKLATRLAVASVVCTVQSHEIIFVRMSDETDNSTIKDAFN